MKFSLDESMDLAIVPGSTSERVFPGARHHRSESSFDTDDLYSILGVERNASNEELKQAYRELASQFHPDRNLGSAWHARVFQRINDAYGILTDSARRSYYDGTGIAPPDEAEIEQRANMCALDKISRVMEDIVNNDNVEDRVLERINPVGLTAELLDKDVSNCETELKNLRKKLKRYSNLEKGFAKKTKKFKTTAVSNVIKEKVANLKKQIQVTELNLRVLKKAAKIIKSQYDFEPPEEQATTAMYRTIFTPFTFS